MGIANIVIAVALVVLLISRQIRLREVKENNPYRLALILGIVGLIQTGNYVERGHPPATAYAVLIVALGLAAGFGFLRALTTQVWRRDDSRHDSDDSVPGRHRGRHQV